MNLVQIENNQPVTSSLQVAEVFEKQHKHVIEAIESKIQSAENSAHYKNMFAEGNYKDSRGRNQKLYYLNKDGWTFIAMGFTGKKADAFKLKYIEAFNQMEKHIKSNINIAQPTQDLETKRMNAEARLENARVRKAKLLSELAKTTTSDVNKVLLEDKAVEVLTGKKMLQMPVMKEKLYDCNEIAKQLGVMSKNNKPHEVAVSQMINLNIEVGDNEAEIFPVTTKHWGGTVMKYTQSVIDRLKQWLEDNNYPSVIKGTSKNYHVTYEMK